MFFRMGLVTILIAGFAAIAQAKPQPPFGGEIVLESVDPISHRHTLRARVINRSGEPAVALRLRLPAQVVLLHGDANWRGTIEPGAALELRFVVESNKGVALDDAVQLVATSSNGAQGLVRYVVPAKKLRGAALDPAAKPAIVTRFGRSVRQVRIK